jgi:hypothetical protein
MDRLRELSAMAGEGLISEQDYEDAKDAMLKKLAP